MASRMIDPSPDRAQPLRDRLLFLVKRRGALSSAEAGAALGVTKQAAQQGFAALAAAGLVRAEDRASGGRGRPRRCWALTGAGHARFPDRHADLTLELIAAAEAAFGPAGLEALIAAREVASRAAYRAATEGRDLPGRVRALAEARAREGYMARVEPAPDGDGWLLIEDHCPICAAAARCQGFCRSELSLFREALGGRVERAEHVLSGARRCVYRVRAAAEET